MNTFIAPNHNCPLCPRLAIWREELRVEHGNTWHNAPVPSFGDITAALLIVGLAPGLHGANRTGRPFTGDYAGIILYNALINTGWAKGVYQAKNPHQNDGVKLLNCRITNAVRCVPPHNKPLPIEANNCLDYLKAEIAAMPNLKSILTLGILAHSSVLKSCDVKLSAHKFGHGTKHQLTDKISLINSYHCSRYNINTGVMTQDMLEICLARMKST